METKALTLESCINSMRELYDQLKTLEPNSEPYNDVLGQIDYYDDMLTRITADLRERGEL